MRFLRILAMIAFIVSLPLSASADIFVKKGQQTGKSETKSIFLNQNDNTNSRAVPQYPIISNGANKSTPQKPIAFGTEGQRLQAQKLRDTRSREYRRNRADSINILTLAEDYSKRTGKTSMSQLLDRSAYNAATQAASQASQQIGAAQAQQQAQAPSVADQYIQNIEKIQQKSVAQADAMAAQEQEKLQEQNPDQSNRFNNTQRRSRGNSGIILTP
jgi:hypothetical protein